MDSVKVIDSYVNMSDWRTQDLNWISEWFRYEAGILYWTKDKFGGKTGKTKVVTAGQIAGCVCKTNGYCKIRFNDRLYKRSQLVFYLFHTYIPKIIDHVDRNRCNDNVDNLRDATASLNTANRESKNYYFDETCKNKKWKVEVGNKTIGRFATEAEAKQTAKMEKQKYLGGLQ